MSEKRDYDSTVEAIAREVIENNGLDEGDWHDAVHENVDGNYYVIYYHGNEECLEATKNEPDPSEVAEMLGGDDQGDWRKVRGIAAFLALEADVYEKLREIVDEYFKCDECDGVFSTDHLNEEDGEHCHRCALSQPGGLKPFGGGSIDDDEQPAHLLPLVGAIEAGDWGIAADWITDNGDDEARKTVDFIRKGC